MNKNHVCISVFCNNVHRSNHITHAILHHLSDPENNTNIIIITEPWIGVVRAETREKGTVHHPDWRCIAPKNVAEADVIVYYKKTAPFRVTPLSHLDYATDYILPTLITIGDSFSLTLTAIYNSPSTHDAITHLQNFIAPDEPTILCGDFNLHSPDWDSTVDRADPTTNAFQDWLCDNSFRVLNDPDKPTFHGHHFQHAKVDDLVIANAKVYEEYDVSPIQVLTEQHFASDHYPIAFNVYTFSEAINPDPLLSLSETHRKEWVSTLTPIFGRLLAQVPENATPQSLDHLSEEIIDAFTTTTHKIMPQRKPRSIHAKHWWNEELSKTVAQLRELASTVKTTRNPYLKRQLRQTKAVFQAKVRHAKRNWATQRLEGATSQTVWEFVKWYTRGGKRCRPLYSCPSNVPAPSDQARAEIFAQQFFPPPPPVQPYSPTDEPCPQRPSHPLIFAEIDNAIQHQRKDTAPGPSQISYTAIKWAWEAAPDLLVYLYSKCLEIGHYPAPFK
jgi:hypothetical protein